MVIGFVFVLLVSWSTGCSVVIFVSVNPNDERTIGLCGFRKTAKNFGDVLMLMLATVQSSPSGWMSCLYELAASRKEFGILMTH